MAKITEEYVSFETAVLLKKKGFDEKTVTYYQLNGYYEPVVCGSTKQFHNRSISKYCRCTQQMAMRWLREVKNLSVEPYYYLTWRYCIKTIKDLKFAGEGKDFDSYEKSCEAAIKYCLENLI